MILFSTRLMFTLVTGAKKQKVYLKHFLNAVRAKCILCYTFHCEVDDGMVLCAETFVSALVLNHHSSQEQGGVSSGDLILEQGRSASEALVLDFKLLFIAVK